MLKVTFRIRLFFFFLKVSRDTSFNPVIIQNIRKDWGIEKRQTSIDTAAVPGGSLGVLPLPLFESLP